LPKSARALPPSRPRGGAGGLYIGNPTAHNYSVGMQTGHLKKALGLRSIYSASTVDQIPHQLVQLWMFGHNSLFPIADIDRTQTMLIIGGNPMASNGSVWTVPGIRHRIHALQDRGGKLIVVDPRRTETAELADTHLFIRPGTDPAFLIALLLALDEAGAADPGRLAPMLEGFDQAIAALKHFDVPTLAVHCGIPEAAIRDVAARLGNGAPAITYGRMGVSTAEFGTLNHWLIQLLNIATGNLDRIGGMMFSNPGVDVVAQTGTGTHGRFKSRVSGLSEIMSELPVVTMAEEIATPGEGRIRALITIAGNPVLSTPEGQALDAALETLDLMVSVDMYVTETSRHADYILPPCGPLQKDHYPLFLGAIAVRNYAKYSPALLPMNDDKSDWEIVAGLASAILTAQGQPAPNIRHPRDTLDAMLKASPHGLSLEQVEAHPHGIDLGELEPGRLPERLRTPTSASAAPLRPPSQIWAVSRRAWQKMRKCRHAGQPAPHRSPQYPLQQQLAAQQPPPAEGAGPLHADDPPGRRRARAIETGTPVTITSRTGAITAPAEVTDSVMPGTVSLPMAMAMAAKA
jgi:anaerobic selenocysteine-containing dehydrogenase